MPPSLKIKSYKALLQEGFAKESTLKVIEKFCLILQRRLGKKIFVGSIPMDIVKQDGRKLSGILCSIMDGTAIRFNWKMTDTSCEIVSIDYWVKIKAKPDYEIFTEGQNILQILKAVSDVLLAPRTGTIMTEDIAVAKTAGKISNEIKDSINAWSKDMDIDPENDLANRRIAELYSGYQYWYQETGLSGNYKQVSFNTFRNYILAYLEKYGIKNIFMRSVKVVDAGKEKIILSDTNEEKKFNADIYKMSLSDKVEFAKMSIHMIMQGLGNCLIMGGHAGVGKSKLVNDALNEVHGKKIVKLSGGIKKPEDLFKVLQNNNSKDTVLVFDDIDSILDKSMLDIMKAITSPDKQRQVTWYSSKINDDDIKKIKTDIDFAIAKQQGLDVKKTNKKSYSPTFIFESKIIIITNKPKAKIHPALISRGTYIEFDVSPKQLIDDIRKNIENIFPEYSDVLTTEMKLEVLDFVEQYLSQIGQFDYRLFKTICGYRAVKPSSPLWKKWAYVALKTA